LTAPDLLKALQAIEQEAGRVRSYQNAPRTLDLDILFYGEAKIYSSWLTDSSSALDGAGIRAVAFARTGTSQSHPCDVACSG
jgi:hypothetical protein